ncbi:MAG: alpha-glucan family phosphorylase [Phycisphaeraceae bacterium]|nr:alpha-glucan family phosphorylase [Phycisphaeraceae bacterium]
MAYFSLEIGIDPRIPTYSGGLGVLAGDTIHAAADLGLPMIGITLLYRKGYFTQSLDEAGRQHEAPTAWVPEELVEEMPPRTYVPIEGRTVHVRAFRRLVTGVGGHVVPVYFLDTDIERNDPRDREITHSLYAGDHPHRIKQEAVLGIAGRRMVRALGYDATCFHMNEGHGCFLTVELLSEHLSRHRTFSIGPDAIDWVRRQCVFTTHTPVEAGHDRFDVRAVKGIIGEHPVFDRPDLIGGTGVLNTTRLALNLSRYANGVARKHGEVSRAMFPGYAIDSVTNGVHHLTWTCPAMRGLFDRFAPDWRSNPSDLRKALGIPSADLRTAREAARSALIDAAGERGARLEAGAFTIGFARRATAYKRPELLFCDPERLRTLARRFGPIQIVFAGKAHPHDGRGKEILRSVHDAAEALREHVRVAILPNYDIALAGTLIAGCDLWLNTPIPPMEASGTSGMKAALNGVPSLSTPDGWWLEGCVEGVTGWGIEGEASSDAALARVHAQSLYDKLERSILPMFREDVEGWAGVMRSAIAINGSYFTTQRMLRDYVLRAYLN